MKVHDAGKLDIVLVGAVEPVSNLAKDIRVRAMRIVKTWSINEKASLPSNSCFVNSYIRGAFK